MSSAAVFAPGLHTTTEISSTDAAQWAAEAFALRNLQTLARRTFGQPAVGSGRPSLDSSAASAPSTAECSASWRAQKFARATSSASRGCPSAAEVTALLTAQATRAQARSAQRAAAATACPPTVPASTEEPCSPSSAEVFAARYEDRFSRGTCSPSRLSTAGSGLDSAAEATALRYESAMSRPTFGEQPTSRASSSGRHPPAAAANAVLTKEQKAILNMPITMAGQGPSCYVIAHNGAKPHNVSAIACCTATTLGVQQLHLMGVQRGYDCFGEAYADLERYNSQRSVQHMSASFSTSASS